jgi:hypothetical protein
MRTTLDIDADILSAAKELARAEGKTLGKIISDLARRALTQPTGGLAEEQSAYKSREYPAFPTFPKRGGPPVTNALVRRIQDEIDVEDSVAWDHEADTPRDFSKKPKR